jgi:hypothetical protein
MPRGACAARCDNLQGPGRKDVEPRLERRVRPQTNPVPKRGGTSAGRRSGTPPQGLAPRGGAPSRAFPSLGPAASVFRAGSAAIQREDRSSAWNANESPASDLREVSGALVPTRSPAHPRIAERSRASRLRHVSGQISLLGARPSGRRAILATSLLPEDADLAALLSISPRARDDAAIKTPRGTRRLPDCLG